MKLTGLTRKSLYNHMTSGRVSYSVGPDRRRYFETAELERAYGKLKAVTHSGSSEIIQSGSLTTGDTGELAKLIEAAVERATAPLVEQIAELHAILRRIEHKPDTPAAPAISPADPPKAASSFADLLAGLGED